MPTVVAMSCLTKWIESVVVSLGQSDNDMIQEWVTRSCFVCDPNMTDRHVFSTRVLLD